MISLIRHSLNGEITVIFSTLRSFLRTGIVSLTFVLLVFFFSFLLFSTATVSAVLQPCRTCHMIFVLLARCVVCVLSK